MCRSAIPTSASTEVDRAAGRGRSQSISARLCAAALLAFMSADDTFSYTFDKPGTYRCVCSIHPQMVASIVVK